MFVHTRSDSTRLSIQIIWMHFWAMPKNQSHSPQYLSDNALHSQISIKKNERKNNNINTYFYVDELAIRLVVMWREKVSKHLINVITRFVCNAHTTFDVEMMDAFYVHLTANKKTTTTTTTTNAHALQHTVRLVLLLLLLLLYLLRPWVSLSHAFRLYLNLKNDQTHCSTSFSIWLFCGHKHEIFLLLWLLAGR